MIVPMKKVTLLALSKDENTALEILRDLGVMQIIPSEDISVESRTSSEDFSSALRTKQLLDSLRPECAEIVTSGTSARGKEIISEANTLFERKSELETEISNLKQRLERLEVWGNFNQSTLNELKEKGVEAVLCSGTRDDFNEAGKLENVTVFAIHETRSNVDFVAVMLGKDNAQTVAKLPVFRLADDDDPIELAKRRANLQQQLSDTEKSLLKLSLESDSLQRCCNELGNAVDFNHAADAMREYGKISVLCGFVPEPEINAVRTAAGQYGWGLLIDDPGEDDDVPVLLKNNRFTRIVKPLFDFLGIAPGYREIDVSGGILIFFTIFYAIIIGDAGYGIIFTLASLLGLSAAKKKPALKRPMQMFFILSVAATIWGALCGSWFGLSVIPGTDIKIPGLECFRDFASSSAKQANIQFFCFILAVLQLSVGRIWRVIRERNWRALGQHLGWIMIIWGNFFLTVRLIVYPGEFPQYMYFLYGIGLFLVVLFGVNWKSAADIFQFPFDIIGSFTDVLSYIRLFAVGLAGACIAGSFNGMAFDVSAVSPWLIPAGILVALAGHLLNIALAFLSVLVHAVRLNTLEFSNHAGLSWSGRNFVPFKKSYKNKE